MLLNDCTKASIYSLQNIFLCDATVSNIRENSVLLTMKDSSADFLTSEINVTFYDGIKGLVTYFCELSGYKEIMTEPNVFISRVTCTLRKQLSVLQRRRDIKVHVNIPIRLSYASRQDVEVNVTGAIRNISAGGVFFTCHYTFLTGSVVEFSFSPRKDIAPLLLRAEILRVQDRESLKNMLDADIHSGVNGSVVDTDLRGYGCRFVDISPHSEAQVRNYVFREDLIRRKKSYAPR